MELALSLGDTRNSKSFSFDLDKNGINMVQKDPGFCMGLGHPIKQLDRSDQINIRAGEENTRGSPDEPFQLDFLHLPRPVQRNQPPSKLRLFPWLTHNCKEDYCVLSELGSSKGQGRGAEVLKRSEDRASLLSSPNSSTVSSILFQNQMDFSLNRRSKRDLERINSIWANRDQYDTDQRGGAGGGSSSRGSDEEDQNGLTRKKLRLSKQQSAFLQDSFKEHNSLNPKQKLDLAKQLNLRARQVEVWFQNRRARTKLKQTEVDCEYLKRCYETLTEENRRLQKEVQELKVLKISQPFYNQLLPATTLTMCLSCDRGVASTAAAAAIDTHH